jgi:mRNA-degrading endonuclease RelE of RelBE toxin-antitoxin system
MGLNPLQGDVVKLKGMDALRRRVGDYRIIFELDLKARSVRILDIARRTTATYR